METATHLEAGERGFKEQFFRHFQCESSALQQRMNQMESGSGGETSTIIEECLSRIAQLSTSVQDASSALPTYDLRTYSDGIKALSERLQQLRSSVAPRQKFSFRSTRRNDTARPARRGPPLTSIVPRSSSSSSSSTTQPTPQPGHSIKATTDNLTITDRAKEHVVLPTQLTPGSKTIALTNLGRCIVQTARSAAPTSQFTSLTLNSIDSSLLVPPPVAGPAHMTNMSNCTLLLQSRQFRLHSCKDVDVYLHCTSRPIIEDCEAIRFAPLSGESMGLLVGVEKYDTDGGVSGSGLNQWDQVDDFKWIRVGEQSPNWRVLRDEERIGGDVWREVLACVEEVEVSSERVEEVLKKTLPVR